MRLKGEKYFSIILMIIAIVMCVYSMLAVFSVLDNGENNNFVMPLTSINTMLIAILIITLNASIKKRAALRIIKKRKANAIKNRLNNMEVKMVSSVLEGLIGKKVAITTLSQIYKGEVREVSENWIKLERQTKKGVQEYIVNHELIVGMKVG